MPAEVQPRVGENSALHAHRRRFTLSVFVHVARNRASRDRSDSATFPFAMQEVRVLMNRLRRPEHRGRGPGTGDRGRVIGPEALRRV